MGGHSALAAYDDALKGYFRVTLDTQSRSQAFIAEFFCLRLNLQSRQEAARFRRRTRSRVFWVREAASSN
jgi:hypothetical protein